MYQPVVSGGEWIKDKFSSDELADLPCEMRSNGVKVIETAPVTVIVIVQTICIWQILPLKEAKMIEHCD
jgi:hypothetical protein